MQAMTRSLYIVYTTSTGHTEFVIDTLIVALEKGTKDTRIVKQRAERTKPEDLQTADILLMACGSWNTGNVEGQLQPYMHQFVHVTAADVDLTGKPAAAIGLGDERYHYTAKAAEHLTDFLKSHGATLILPALKVINEPYDQEEKINLWATELLKAMDKLPPSMPHQ